MSPAPIMPRAGSMARKRTGVDMTPIITDRTTVWDASLSALCFSPLPRYLAMDVAAPMPRPVPSPETIQYMGDMVETAELASAPSPEHQDVSAKRLIWTTRYDTMSGRSIERMAPFGSPSILSRSLLSPAMQVWTSCGVYTVCPDGARKRRRKVQSR